MSDQFITSLGIKSLQLKKDKKKPAKFLRANLNIKLIEGSLFKEKAPRNMSERKDNNSI